MRRIFTMIIVLGSLSFLSAQAEDQIQTIINKVSIDTLIYNLRGLSGDIPVKLNNTSVSLLSRNRLSPGNSYVPTYLDQMFSRFGLVSLQQNFMTDGTNVYAIQTGVTKPNQYVIICAHYDDMPYSGIAPGADDNGSGTIAVLEAARILSKYKFDYTIIYALWDLEEYGLHGSYYYAQEASSRGDNIVAVINLDMIGWDSNNDFKAEVHTKNISSTNELGQLFPDTNQKYSIGLNLFVTNPGSTSSDHASFWRFNYPAVLLIEIKSDFNLYYHKSTDDISKINKVFYEKMTKLGIAVTAASAVISQNTSVESILPTKYALSQNYPNPFNPETTISYEIKTSSIVTLKVHDVLGNEVATLVDEFKDAGTYRSNFSIKNSQLPTGVYFYTIRADQFYQTKKMMLIK
ncbi:MAG: M28 family peptidase [Melioribacteraceae bacterium]